MLNDILLIADEPLEVKERYSERTILPTSSPLGLGVYDVYCNGFMEMNKEPCFLLYPHKAKKVNAVAARTHSEASGFKHTLEQRDSMCVFSRNHIVNPPRGGAVWSGFTCAPIVPIQLTGTSDMFDASKLSSSGNRLLMSHYLNLVFTVGCIAVNPDNYCF